MALIKDFYTQSLLNTEGIEVDGTKISPRKILLEFTKEPYLNSNDKDELHLGPIGVRLKIHCD